MTEAPQFFVPAGTPDNQESVTPTSPGGVVVPF